MGEAQNHPIERNEATNEVLSDAELSAIKLIVEATKNDPSSKDKVIKEHFDLSELQNKDQEKIAYIIEKQIQGVYAEYKNNSGGAEQDKLFLDIAFGLMQLKDNDKYGTHSTFYKTYVLGEGEFKYQPAGGDVQTTKDQTIIKAAFYHAVEMELEKLFIHPSDIFEKYNKETITIKKDEYEANKNQYDKQGWVKKEGTERTIDAGSETILVPGKPIALPTQYFYKGSSQVDLSKAIQDKVPELKTNIEALKNNPNIDPTSIEIHIKSSVSNITFSDNVGLLGRRSTFYKNIVEQQLPGQNVVIDNEKYVGYGSEWGPAYPPTKQDLEQYFGEGSEGLKALQNVAGFNGLDEVVQSLAREKTNSKYFDVIEMYMYRLYQYTTAEVVYKEKKEVKKDEIILDLEKQKGSPEIIENTLNRSAGNIITKNPYYEKIENQTHKYKQKDGITYPINSEYMILQLSDRQNASSPIQRRPYAERNYRNNIAKSITNRSLAERQRGESKNYGEQLTLLLDGTEETIKNFSQTLIGSDEIAGRNMTNKETNTFINTYIQENIQKLDATVETETNRLGKK